MDEERETVPDAAGVDLYVLTLAGDPISAMVRFDAGVLASCGLPGSLPRR